MTLGLAFLQTFICSILNWLQYKMYELSKTLLHINSFINKYIGIHYKATKIQDLTSVSEK